MAGINIDKSGRIQDGGVNIDNSSTIQDGGDE